MSKHRVLAQRQGPNGEMWYVDDVVDYVGAPHWTLEPLDTVDRECWEREAADADRVEAENSRVGSGLPVMPPAGVYTSANATTSPPSGWSA